MVTVRGILFKRSDKRHGMDFPRLNLHAMDLLLKWRFLK